jgi:endonuclease/exonuclease/phosphatase family metal-dependent hydrolase
MLKKLLLVTCAGVALTSMGQTKNFKAACLNVDGLPPSINVVGINISLNPDGPQEAGTKRISELIAQKGWDFFGVSEDFNYHNELITHFLDYYNIGSYRGNVSLSNASGVPLKMNTDGLGLMYKKSIKATGETMTSWNKTNGYFNNGADELLKKGYRYYCVSVANGLEVDVYVHHMDAETDKEDIEARESQITQLVEAIKNSDNHRPIIIMGDSNCRYTRDRVKELLIDAINADERFEIHDPWIDFEWNGIYPEYGSTSLMTSEYGAQKGEVVDKIFYINNSDANGVVLTANSYLHDTEFSYADGSSISDHYPIVIDFTISNTTNDIAQGSYYIRNVASGEFLCAGANYGTHTALGETGNYITLEKADDNQYYMHSTCGYVSHSCWMDNDKDAYTISMSESGNYVIAFEDENGDKKAFTAHDDMRVEADAYEKDNLAQEWEFLSKDELIKELYSATEDNPKDATFFIKGANFSRNDSDVKANWEQTKDSGLSINYGGLDTEEANNHIVEFYNGQIGTLSSTKTSGSLTQSAEGLPNGKYRMSVQVFKREDGDNFTISANGNNVRIPGISEGAQNGVVPNSISSAAEFFNAGLYKTETEFTITDHALTILINKAHTKSTKWYAFDNFKLTYLGPTDEDNAAYNKVKAAMYDAESKATEMSLDYDNSVVEERWENREIVGNGDAEVKMTYLALAKAAKQQTQTPADMRYVILNNSFEMGDLTYWDTNEGSVVENDATMNGDGDYVFKGTTISQSTASHGINMPNGNYKLTALLSEGGKLIANGAESGVAIVSAAEDGAMTEVSVKFEVTEGTVAISATNIVCADNFVLTYLGEEKIPTTGVSDLKMSGDAQVDVYGVNGVLLKRGVTYGKALDGLAAGVYIVRNGERVQKLVK